MTTACTHPFVDTPSGRGYTDEDKDHVAMAYYCRKLTVRLAVNIDIHVDAVLTSHSYVCVAAVL